MEGIYFWEKGGVVNGENNIFRKSGCTKMMERIENREKKVQENYGKNIFLGKMKEQKMMERKQIERGVREQ